MTDDPTRSHSHSRSASHTRCETLSGPLAPCALDKSLALAFGLGNKNTWLGLEKTSEIGICLGNNNI